MPWWFGSVVSRWFVEQVGGQSRFPFVFMGLGFPLGCFGWCISARYSPDTGAEWGLFGLWFVGFTPGGGKVVVLNHSVTDKGFTGWVVHIHHHGWLKTTTLPVRPTPAQPSTTWLVVVPRQAPWLVSC